MRRRLARPARHPFLRLWGWPISLGLLTLVGLIAALVGDGWFDTVSAVTLGLPVVAGAWFSLRRHHG